jgi:P-type Cu+ transporter
MEHREARDPVCGSIVNAESARHAKLEEADYYFCSDTCLHKFLENASKYVAVHPEADEGPTS